MRPSALLIALLVLLVTLIPACSEPQLVDADIRERRPPQQELPTRPDVPRVELPPEPERRHGEAETATGVWVDFLDTPRKAGEGIIVGDAAHPLLFGTTLGELLPVLTRQELAMLAVPDPVARGRMLRAESLVRLDFDEETSGQLRFSRDPDTERVQSELFFAEEEPMVEYAYLLKEGSFPLLLEQPITFFGEAYRVADLSNTTLVLENEARTLTLENGSRLRIDADLVPDTRVEADPWHATITYLAPDVDDGGLRLRPGESLRAKMENPEALLGTFDIIYEGLEQNLANVITLDADDDAALTYHDPLGDEQRVRIAILDGGVRLGDEDGRLHIKECGACIDVGDSFLLETPLGTRIFRFTSLNEDVLSLRDVLSGERHVVELENVSGRRGTLGIEGQRYTLRVDSGLLDAPVRDTLLLHDGHALNFRDDGTVRFAFESPFEENLIFSLFEHRDRILVEVEDLPLERVGDRDLFVGATERGAMVTLESSDGLHGEELSIAYPVDYRAGMVRIVG